jgi:hypothetical protein
MKSDPKATLTPELVPQRFQFERAFSVTFTPQQIDHFTERAIRILYTRRWDNRSLTPDPVRCAGPGSDRRIRGPFSSPTLVWPGWIPDA